jgi:putative FmdB family regulatory protein
MPIYEYACGKCGREFEVEQRISDDPIKTCPHCRSRKVKRLISRTSFVLKGSGWYSDLYSSSKPDTGKSEGKSESGGDAATPSDAKPEKKGDAKTGEKSGSKGKTKGKGKSKAA